MIVTKVALRFVRLAKECVTYTVNDRWICASCESLEIQCVTDMIVTKVALRFMRLAIVLVEAWTRHTVAVSPPSQNRNEPIASLKVLFMYVEGDYSWASFGASLGEGCALACV